MNTTVFSGSNENVKKFVFDFKDAIAEAVVYKYPTYEERTVLCVSIQSGCPVGCTFCGTGNKFIRNLTKDEILSQIIQVFKEEGLSVMDVLGIKKFQIMFMSMGEPFLNYKILKEVIEELSSSQYGHPDLLVSTIAPDRKKEMVDFIKLSKEVSEVGLQFSIHKSNDGDRNILIPYKKKLDLREIRNYGIEWWKETGRKPYLNYCIDGNNNSEEDFKALELLFPQNVFNFTFSVVCSAEEGGFSFRDMEKIQEFENRFISAGYDTRVFDPAGQDDIGGGCGQLWFVQEWMKRRTNEKDTI